MTRRTFLADLGRFTLGFSVLGLAACGAETGGSESSTSSSTTPPSSSTSSSTSVATSTTAATGVDWRRVDFGNVSAVVLARAGESAIVDTGNPGDEGEILATLEAMGLGWASVSHVIVTHRHGDHQGSLEAVMSSAVDASGYCGAGDLEAIGSPRPLQTVGTGDQVFGLDIIDTPGHTPGHISVLEPTIGLLIAGDALNGAGSGVEGSEGGVGGANPRFTTDMGMAAESIKSLATLSFDIAVFGHGAPLEGGASEAVAALAATL